MRFFVFMLAILSFSANAAPINPVNDIVARGIQCANGKYAPAGAECPPGQSLILFEENFDAQPDWTSGLLVNDLTGNGVPDYFQIERTGHSLPDGWDSAIQQPTYAPSLGDVDKMENVSILSSLSSYAFGGTGKSAVFTRDNQLLPSWFWSSDGALVKIFDQDYDQIYVEFWIRFSPNWTKDLNTNSKIFRVSSWKRSGSEFQAFDGGDLGPIAIWNYVKDDYGVRNVLTLRGGPHGDNYTIDTNLITDYPAGTNFTTHTVGQGANGSDPLIPDRLNGGYISDNLSQTVQHAQIYGGQDEWTKLAFFVKMNSAPGVADGVFWQWLNDERIRDINGIPWMRASVDENVNAGWNLVEIGGNDYFKVYPDEDKRQEWYSIDNLVIRTEIPEGLQ